MFVLCFVCVCVCVYVYVCVCVCMLACMRACMHACMHAHSVGIPVVCVYEYTVQMHVSVCILMQVH